MVRPRTRGLVLALALVLGASAALAQGQARKPFTSEERARLAKGELVTRPAREKRGALRLIGGSAWQVVDAPPQVLFEALLDTPHYPRMLPTVSGAELVSKHPTLRRVRLEHKRGPLGIAYRLALEIKRDERVINFKLNDPLDSGMRAAWGYLSVRPHGSKSLLSYGLMVDPGDGLIVAMVRGVIQEWMLKVPQQVRYFVESKKGRALYGSGAVGGCRKLDGSQAQKCAP